jgi:segregation and condensation protein A
MIQESSNGSPEVLPPGGYLVRLENFEGPLDLLLHLIKEDEVEIWEISISRITRQYVNYLEKMQELNIEIAGEFLVMAAALMRIKSRKLLPRPEATDQESDEPETEEELIERLLTYRTFKEVAAALKRRKEEVGPRFRRGFRAGLPGGYDYPLEEVDLFTLVSAMREIEERAHGREEVFHEVRLEDVRLEDQVAMVLGRLEEAGGRVAFGRLFSVGSRRMEIAVTFLAILELARQQVIALMQDVPYEEIWVVSRVHEDAVVT